MLKILGNKLGEYNKSCRIFHKESNKLSLHFSEFTTILYRFYKIQQFTTTIEDSLLHLGPWKELDPHRYTLGSRIRPWKEMGPSNWVPRPMEAAGSPESERP
jgi:hypothetical protein